MAHPRRRPAATAVPAVRDAAHDPDRTASPVEARDVAHCRVYRLLGGRHPAPALHCLGWDLASDLVRLRYRIDGLADFTETVRFPGVDLATAHTDATSGALDVLLAAACTSYYKAVVPGRVVLGPASAATVAMVEALLTDGLAEFATQNHLAPDDRPEVFAEIRGATTGRPRPSGVLVPIGGGKDSALSASLAVASGLDAVGFAVNPRDSMRRTAAATGLPLMVAERRLDPQLLELNAAGALNGHVPITAIVASIAAVAATLDDRGDVLLSNEASADEPTRYVGGRPINHQYSKSSAFEQLLTRALASTTGGAVRPLSWLRPLPELVVAAAFARQGVSLTAVNSCNRAYSLTGEGTEWCGTCPKCLFVELMVAPFTTPAQFVAGTGFDALADLALIDAYGDLLDPARKPYECVGTVTEVQLAFDLLADDPAWAEHAAVRAHGRAGTHAQERFVALVTEVDTGALPAAYRPLLDATLAQLVDGRRG